MKTISSPQHYQSDEEIIEVLKRLRSLESEYPSDLFAARRADYILQVEQMFQAGPVEDSASDNPFIRQLEGMKAVRSEYPPELLAARRANFVNQIKGYNGEEVTEELYPRDQEIIRLLKSIKSAEAEYPSGMMAARRMVFRRQIALGGSINVLEALRAGVRSLLSYRPKPFTLPTMNTMRTSLVLIVLFLAAFAGSLLKLRVQPTYPSTAQTGGRPSVALAAATRAGEPAQVICKPGYFPPLCLAKEFDHSQNLTFQGNGSARPAVAKDTLPGYNGVHRAAYINDGLYGPGASWISNSAYSWIKIDLGKPTTINTVAFGRDRLGSFNDRDPGQFVIAVALNDAIYADGNSSNDYFEYTEIYNSEQMGFDGLVSGPETVKAQFGPVVARYVKIIFANSGTAVDEIEVFMVQPPVLASNPTKKPDEDSAVILPTTIPTRTAFPTKTATLIPTNTPLPSATSTPIPTNTPPPTDTPLPPPPTDTPEPPPTDTPLPPPPPTDTPEPPPTDPPPTIADTFVPPTDVVEPLVVPTETSVLVEVQSP